MLGLRVISALVGIPVLIGIIYVGDVFLAGSLLLLIILGTLEFQEFIKKSNGKVMFLPVLLGQIVLTLGAFAQWAHWFSIGILIMLLLTFIQGLAKFPQYNLLDFSTNLFMLIYVGWTLNHLILLRNLDQGFWLVLFLFLIIWSSDTGAYFSGRFFGKNKLAPQVSPNKTIEGSIGGLFLSVIIGIIYNYYLNLFSLPIVLFLALLLSVIGQMGDLIESALKRLVGVKDSGNLIPGHGGILDRFDSTITTAPVFFYLLILLSKVG
ncbi:MAG: phosphatidate cytidylyltransferase [Clostridia bacterium]|jgi:phosphatidate cytidylyltransferase|nr:phosphatidate cytidylyltransferase [Clostridia bacterium]